MSPVPLLVVVGATGSQGSSVLRYFQQLEPTFALRGLTRDPSSAAAQALAKSGVEIVKADLEEPETLRAAFKDATAIFAYTDFNGIVGSAAVMGKFMAGQLAPPIGAAAYEIETRQGRNIADAAAGVPGLKRLVWSSLADVTKWSKGKYQHVFHFDAKAAVTEYMLHLPGLEDKVSMVQMMAFADNANKNPQVWGFAKKADGSFTWASPLPGNLLIHWVDVAADTGAFVAALLKAPAGTHLEGVSDHLSAQAWLDLWTARTGAKASIVPVSPEKLTQADPSGLNRELAETFLFVEEFSLTGGDPDIKTPDQLEKEGFAVPRTKIADHIKRTDWSPLLNLEVKA